MLVLLHDAYGGHGGIAKFNRDLLSALAELPDCAGVVAVPIFKRLGLGSVLGYLAAGVVIINRSEGAQTGNLTSFLFGSIATTTRGELVVFGVLSSRR